MKELADYLKSERLSRNQTLREMSERVRVSVSMFQALEEGNYEKIGTDLLIRSFIRNYCSALGIDSEPLLEKYASEIRAYDQQDESIQRYGKWSKAIRKKSRIGIFSVLLVGIAVLGAVYGGVYFWKSKEYSDSSQSLRKSGYPQQDLPSDLPSKTGQDSGADAKRDALPEAGKGARSSPETSGSKAERTQPVAMTPKPQETAPAGLPAMGIRPGDVLRESAEEKPVTAAQANGKHQFSVEASQKTWIQVTIDDKGTQNAMLEPGDKREWEAGNAMKIVVGNAGGIRMRWDGRPVEIPAKPGSVIRFSLPDQRYVKE
jgi:cytoskeleton protein RodZ